MGALLIESIGDHPFRDLVASKTLRSSRSRGSAGNCRRIIEKQLEPGHARHLQIGDDDVGKTSFASPAEPTVHPKPFAPGIQFELTTRRELYEGHRHPPPAGRLIDGWA